LQYQCNTVLLYFIIISVLSSKNDINHKSQKIKKNVYPTHPFKMICTLCNSKMCCCSVKTFNQTKHAWNQSNNDWFSHSPLQGSSKGAAHVSFFLFIFTHTQGSEHCWYSKHLSTHLMSLLLLFSVVFMSFTLYTQWHKRIWTFCMFACCLSGKETNAFINPS